MCGVSDNSLVAAMPRKLVPSDKSVRHQCLAVDRSLCRRQRKGRHSKHPSDAWSQLLHTLFSQRVESPLSHKERGIQEHNFCVLGRIPSRSPHRERVGFPPSLPQGEGSISPTRRGTCAVANAAAAPRTFALAAMCNAFCGARTSGGCIRLDLERVDG